MASTVIGAGFTIDPSKAKAAKATAAPGADHVETDEEELARMVITRLRQGFTASALAAAVDLVNNIAATYDMQAYASL